MNHADAQSIFNSQVRALQILYPLAHAACRNWGFWSRETQGIFPALARPSWTDLYQAPESWADDEGLDPPPITEQVKAERAEQPRSDERSAVDMDVRLHGEAFPAVWRRVLSVTYLTLETPEYDLPRQSRLSDESFLFFLEGALGNLQEVLA